MPEPTALPNDASLKVYAATDPERLYVLATEPARTACSLFAPEVLKLVELLTGQRSQAATDCAVRLGEHAARLVPAPGAAQLMDHVVRELGRRSTLVHLRPHFERAPTAEDPVTEFRARLLHELALGRGLRDERTRPIRRVCGSSATRSRGSRSPRSTSSTPYGSARGARGTCSAP
ncbi:hypothetical protein [Streptomyces sp. NPDC048350]|uniref:hypothetical protein n=1 Tax=Streptomyces sp. NPDC048350 TaxID=3365538 RepID=UPI003721ED36